MARKLISQYHPWLYFACIWAYRFKRILAWHFSGKKYARSFNSSALPFRTKKHESVLIRKLGTPDQRLQVNKVTNLKVAANEINGVIIRPGETFSFCRLVGLPTKRKGYLPGMELSNGEAREGIGGGICQLSNLIHWMILHSPLIITERRHHSFDPFPDEGRVLPFGSGATVFYNYIDFRFENKTPFTFQLLLWVTDKHLCGDLRSDESLPHSYFVYEDKHQFLKIKDKYYRRNEIWRRIHARAGGEMIEREFMLRNFAEVKYIPPQFQVEPQPSPS
jgi:vancomycin resistance protein VanW